MKRQYNDFGYCHSYAKVSQTCELFLNTLNIMFPIFCLSSFSLCFRILSITDRVGDRMDFSGDIHNTTVPSLALQLIDLDPLLFQGLTFGVSSFQKGLSPEVKPSKDP